MKIPFVLRVLLSPLAEHYGVVAHHSLAATHNGLLHHRFRTIQTDQQLRDFLLRTAHYQPAIVVALLQRGWRPLV